MRTLASALLILVSFCAATSYAAQETLQNDAFVSGGTATFQGGFISTEIAAARFTPTIACPCVLDSVTLLFGGSTDSRTMGVLIWDDPGADAPGNLLFSGDVTLPGSTNNLQLIDLGLTPIILNGAFRVGLEFDHDGLPSVATDTDGTIDTAANFIFADVGGLNFWFRSSTLGVGGDFIMRATIDNLQVSDMDGDGIADNDDNCFIASNPQQEDSDADGIGNACDADFNNDCIVNATDLGTLRVSFFATDADPNWNPDTDINSDGVINVIDLGALRSLFFAPPGPSGIPNICSFQARVAGP